MLERQAKPNDLSGFDQKKKKRFVWDIEGPRIGAAAESPANRP